MKRSLLVPLAFLLAACGSAEPEVVVVEVTSTPRPVTATPSPTHTPLPTPTSEPLWEPVLISEIESAFRDDGYQREPFMTDSGVSGFIWTKDNIYERVVTWEDGEISLEVLHDKSPQTRAQHMERKFKVLDKVLPASFMAALREENDAYNGKVASTVSGEPEDIFNWGDRFNTVKAEYYVSSAELDGYTVWWSLWFKQSTCPSKYLYCYWPGFPGLEFTGDSSFIYYTIVLVPYEPMASSSSG